MKNVKERVPEGGAIRDEGNLSAERYGEIMKRRLGGEYRRFAARVLDLGKPSENARVLEIGPGPGWISVLLATERPDLRIDMVELSPDMIRASLANLAAAGIGDRATVIQGCAERVDEAVEGPYDLIYSRDSLHHWEDPPAAFSRFHALLSPGGALVLQDERRDIGMVARLLVAVLSRAMGAMGAFWRSSIAAGYTAAECARFLESAGFSQRRAEAEFLSVSLFARK